MFQAGNDAAPTPLNKRIKAARLSAASLAAEAIREFVENNEWQIAEIRAALKEADALAVSLNFLSRTSTPFVL
jgi:hypothetical protein